MKVLIKYLVFFSIIPITFSCSNFFKTKKHTDLAINATDTKIITKPVDISLFETENLAEPITKQKIKLNDGTTKEFYKIVIKPHPTEHQTGPWCPTTITDTKEKGGLWFKDGHIYDVSGDFVAHLDDFYNDPNWKVYKENGEVKITLTQEACEAAAKPNVEEEYFNHCVQCLPSYYEDLSNTFFIPVEPTYQQRTSRGGRGGLGIAFNGVKFEEPAPINEIIKAHTIAPLDDCGGHVNAHVGYHYHAVTGCTKKIEQPDNHTALIGYAVDGFGIYEYNSKEESKTSVLDDCNGHSDNIRGYHYHVNEPGKNQIISCLHGVVATNERDDHRPPPPPRRQ